MVETNAFIEARKKALEKYFDGLNPEQKKAVFTVCGPVLVLAGAGSGKTSVLVNRCVNLIYFGNAYMNDKIPEGASEDDLAFLRAFAEGKETDASRLRDIVACDTPKSWNILAITFTNKAAGELRDRITAKLGEEGQDICAATFHSACVRILRREIEALGYGSSFAIYDSDDSQRLLKACIAELDVSEKLFPPKSMAGIISSAKDKLITPQDFLENTQNDYRKTTIAKIYKLYQDRLRSANALDFDDIICLTVELFEKFPDILDKYRRKYKYIMVDEYQDTNQAQYRLISLLSAGHKNLCVVGDDDQSIYKFRGATIENILSFEEQFENAAVIRLEQNYRSTQNILSAANGVIGNNTGRKEKKLWTENGDGDKVVLFKAPDEAAESKFVANKILENVHNGMSYKDHAVLYRMNAQSNSLERAMTASGIPYRVIGGVKFYDRKEIKDVIAYLSVINNPRDMLRFKRIINEPKRGIGDTTVSMIEQIANDLGSSPIEIMRDAENYPLLSKKASALSSLAKTFDMFAEKAEELELPELLDLIMDKSGYAAALAGQGDEGQGRLENIAELKSTMQEYTESSDEPSLSEFLEEISLYTDVDRLSEDDNAVCLMTMHSAKGLEFPEVFIVGMEEGIFPGTRSMDTLEDMEEERRLAYVAITRAKKHLYLTYAAQRMIFGSTTRNFVSRFVKEIDSDLLEKIDRTVKIKKVEKDEGIIAASGGRNPFSLQNELMERKTAAAKQSAAASADYSEGERVKHKVFGEGTIVSVKKMSNDAMLEVNFDNVGTKKIMANFAKLTKLS
ncbi:MAG: UvrD-helicase domain-containing protein [Ruminococcus sp.]|nr:UvrD-helicase domain-containing protein [Ruminococcus sp.]